MNKGLDERQQQAEGKAGIVCFYVMFAVCAAAIAVQLLFTGAALYQVLGETVVLLAGGISYLACCIKNGSFSKKSAKIALKDHVICSIVCSGIFSVLFGITLGGMGGRIDTAKWVGLFFLGITVLCFIILAGLGKISRMAEKKQENKYSD